MGNFWKELHTPLFVMAPLADVTDSAFRKMFAKYGRPDVTWTEFVSAVGLFLAPESDQSPINIPSELRAIAEEYGVAPNNPLLKDLIYTEEERPIVAQFFSRDAGRMKRAAELAVALGFDGVDINMGCPAKVIVGQGAGCAMIQEPEVARAVIRACKEGADGKIPVSVKTRIGFNKDELDTWLPEILAEGPAVVSLHARTRRDMSKVPAKWGSVKQAVEIRDSLGNDALIIGNGDVGGLDEGLQRVKETGCDGVMVGRGLFGDPTFFKQIEKARADFSNGKIGGRGDYHEERSLPERAQQLIEHTYLFEELLGDSKNFYIMKKHFKAYISGFPATAGRNGAKEIRAELMQAETAKEVEAVLKAHI